MLGSTVLGKSPYPLFALTSVLSIKGNVPNIRDIGKYFSHCCICTYLQSSFSQLPNQGFNATINLTGHIILGLGIAAALLLHMFFTAFDRKDYSYYNERSLYHEPSYYHGRRFNSRSGISFVDTVSFHKSFLHSSIHNEFSKSQIQGYI